VDIDHLISLHPSDSSNASYRRFRLARILFQKVMATLNNCFSFKKNLNLKQTRLMLKTRQHIGYAAFIACVMLRTTATAFAVPAGAKPLTAPATEPSIQIVMSGQNDSAIRLEARLAPLGKILKELSAKTGAVIHYSVLPEAPVTATCAGATVSEIMDCLVAKQVGLVANKPEPGKPAEFWLLGTSVGSCKAMTVESAPAVVFATAVPVVDNAKTKPAPPNKEYSDALLAGLKDAKTVEERKNALSYLTAGADLNDPNVRSALTEAMADKNPAIRSQAMSSMASLDKDNATEIIGRYLHDSDSTVRMAAIESAADNRELLEQAVTDGDNSISSYAAAKLAVLLRNRERFGLQQ
jgi:hypothetical protein